MFRAFFYFLVAALLPQIAVAPALAQGNCAFCDIDPGDRGCENGNGKKKKKDCDSADDPIDLTIETDINFGRLIMYGDGLGQVIIDLESGTKTVTGDLDDLGGIAMTGKAVVTGVPSRAISIDFPTLVTLRDPSGGAAELRDFETNLPVQAYLDENGRLEFSFTGTLYTGQSSSVGGNLRGKVPIRVDYD